MMTINSTFNAEFGDRLTFHQALTQGGTEKHRRALLLRGIEIDLAVDDKVYTLSSSTAPLATADSPLATAWPRWIFRLPNGSSVEQQMVLPAGGNAVALSWRLLDDAASPVTLAVTPVFEAVGLTSARAFRRESDARGGRLTWQPLDDSLEIIADTNGQMRPVSGDENANGRARPTTFEFVLRRRPAILVFSLAHPSAGGGDPLIGGFLAQLAAEQFSSEPIPAEKIQTALLAA